MKRKVRIILFTGKGGVGKSTAASATGLKCAELGYKTIVLSTDPAHSVTDVFNLSEKLILDKRADFIMGGPIRSEAGMAAQDLIAKHKRVSILTTGVLTPKYHARVAKEYDRLKYLFRLTGEAK